MICILALESVDLVSNIFFLSCFLRNYLKKCKFKCCGSYAHLKMYNFTFNSPPFKFVRLFFYCFSFGYSDNISDYIYDLRTYLDRLRSLKFSFEKKKRCLTICRCNLIKKIPFYMKFREFSSFIKLRL